VPVFDRSGELVAVFDVDSDEYDAFDQVDQRYLEHMMAGLAGLQPNPIWSTQ
jgi:GAF domain-containing protein